MESAVCTDIGDSSVNEDCAGRRQCTGFTAYALADGLGGHGGGDVASRTAVEAVLAAAEHADGMSMQLMAECFEAAQTQVLAGQTEGGRKRAMRTTLVVLFIGDGRAMWGHIGDTRLYLFRRGRMKRRTRDHSVAQMLLSSGKIREGELRRHEDRSVLLRAVGSEWRNGRGGWEPGGDGVRLHPSDVFALCTDGVWEWLEDDRLAALACGAGELPAAASAICAEARERSGGERMDNNTVMLVRPCGQDKCLLGRLLRRGGDLLIRFFH